MTSLGDLTKLLDQGYLTEEYLFNSADGDYKFEIKTISPLEEVQAQKRASSQVVNPTEYEAKVHEAIETLSICVTKVNGIELAKLPGAKGETELEKARSIVKRFSEKILVDLWVQYQDLKRKSLPSGTKEEAETIKK
jgi:hypothetical protein